MPVDLGVAAPVITRFFTFGIWLYRNMQLLGMHGLEVTGVMTAAVGGGAALELLYIVTLLLHVKHLQQTFESLAQRLGLTIDEQLSLPGDVMLKVKTSIRDNKERNSSMGAMP